MMGKTLDLTSKVNIGKGIYHKVETSYYKIYKY